MRYDRDVPGYYVENFGCRATQADGAALERQFEERGMSRASTPAQASVVVLNTCTVTAAADQDARSAIRRVRRRNPEAQIVVTGCYAQRAPDEIAALPGVSFVIGNSHKHQLVDLMLEKTPVAETTFIPLASLTENRELRTENSIFVSDIFAHTELLAAPVFDAANERTRPNLKVQDGCDNRCSFCVIPYVRGQSRSLGLDRIIREVNGLLESGYRELVVSGINLGRWGRDRDLRAQPSAPSQNLTSDVRRPRSDTQRLTPEAAFPNPSRKPEGRLRRPDPRHPLRDCSRKAAHFFGRADGLDRRTDFLVASSPRIAKHAHVPMQSGSDAVLRRMHRKYRPWHYRAKIEKIRAAMPTAAIGADVMVGFPGETDSEFEATRRMIEDLPFTYLHVFTYSARPGTPAAEMANQVPVHIARQRNRILRELAAEKKLSFMRGFIGKEIEAITLRSCGVGAPARDVVDSNSAEVETSTSGFTEALTDNYLKLRLRGHHEPNRWLHARIDDVVDGALTGVRPL